MSSCCSHELIFNSVANEIVSSNLELFSYIGNVVYDYWGYFGATIIGIVVLVVARKIDVGLKPWQC